MKMARNKLPDPLERRHSLVRPMDAAEALRIAEAYLAEGRQMESLAFFAKAGARERLEGLAREALAAGDAFLLREVSACLGEEPDSATWLALAEAAEAAGKERYALEARRLATREA
jgi:hypothetical protein